MKLKEIALPLISVTLMLAISEAGLQLANYPATPEIGWRWAQSPYRAAFNKDDQGTNQLGLRGRKFDYAKDDFVVILLGDSQVEAGTQTADVLPEILLEKALQQQIASQPDAQLARQRIKVFSIASAGWGQDQQLLWLKQYFASQRADLVLVWPTPVNDYWENTFVERSITPEAGHLKPTFTLNDGQLTQVMPAKFEYKLKNLIGLALGHSAAKQQKEDKFTLEQLYADRWQARLPSAQNQDAMSNQCPASEILEKNLIEAYMAGSRAYTLVTDEDVAHGRSHFSPFLQQMSERDHYSVDLTHKLLEEIAQSTQQHHAGFQIFHPYRSDLDAAFREIKCVKTSHGKYFAYDGSDWLRFLKQSPLKESLLPLDITHPTALNVSQGDWHLGTEGNTLVMQTLAKKLIDKGLIKVKP